MGIIYFWDWFQKCKTRFIWNLSNCQNSVTDISREAACQNLTPEKNVTFEARRQNVRNLQKTSAGRCFLPSGTSGEWGKRRQRSWAFLCRRQSQSHCQGPPHNVSKLYLFQVFIFIFKVKLSFVFWASDSLSYFWATAEAIWIVTAYSAVDGRYHLQKLFALFCNLFKIL